MMSSYEPAPPKGWRGNIFINEDDKNEFIKWLRKHINEQITGHLIKRAEEEL